MKLSAKEIEIMSTKNGKERYIYFIKRVVDNEAVWVLEDNGFALSGDDSGHDMLMLWPAREYASVCATEDWGNYKAKELTLDYVIEKPLSDLSMKGVKLGVFMVPSIFDTPVINADNLLLDLENEYHKYD
ncbi:DUF2750 domain-containing protein [Kluyvera intermedia]|uniref:DUF2750 domain-containing protein n=1 Tax=Kluyvera intermedia TaxID=61648 RepID=UPI0034A45E65